MYDMKLGIPSSPSISDSGTLRDDIDDTESSLTDTDGTSQYLYYRVYAEDGAIRSMQPLDVNDPSLSRIYARSVAPPHTVASLKSRLRGVENIRGDTNLYFPLPSPIAMDDGERILLHAGNSPGLTTQHPVAIVVKCSDPERTAVPTADTDSSTEDTQFPEETRYGPYVYYRVYTAGGDIPSKQPVDPKNSSLGRIRIDSIPPPRTVASMRKTISRVENFSDLPFVKLFVNMFTEFPMDEEDKLNLATFSVDKPLAFVLPTILKGRVTCNYRWHDKSFLKVVKGDTYYTDGILLKRPYQGKDLDVYQAATPAGDAGFIVDSDVDPVAF